MLARQFARDASSRVPQPRLTGAGDFVRASRQRMRRADTPHAAPCPRQRVGSTLGQRATHTRVGGSSAPARIAAAQLARVVAPSNAVRSILGCTAQEHFSRQCRTSARRTRRSNKRASRATLLAGVLRHLQPTTRERVTQPCPHSKALHVSTRPFRTQILAKPLSLCPRTPSILDRLLKSKARSSAATSLRRPRSCSAALWPDGVCVRRRRRAHIFVSQCERSEQEAPG